MAKKKKVRVAFKKNRQKRTRANDLTRQYQPGRPGAGRAGRRPSASAPRGTCRGTGRSSTEVAEAGDAAEAADGDRRRARRARSTSRPACRAGSSGSTGCSRSSQTDDGRTYPLPRPPAPQDPGDRRPERRHRRRPRLVPARRRGGRRGADREGRAPPRDDHPRLSPPQARPRRQRRPGPHRLGPRRARAEARPDRPLPDLGRDRRRPAGDRPEQGRPRRPRRSTSGSIGLYTQLGYETLVTSAADGRGIDRLRDAASRRGRTAVLGPERRRQELAPERDPAGPEPPGPRGLRLDRPRGSTRPPPPS